MTSRAVRHRLRAACPPWTPRPAHPLRIAAAGCLGLLLSVSGSVSAQSALRPVVECVEEADAATYRAHFGYANDNPAPVSVPLGSDNRLSGTVLDGQPVTSFAPGRQRFAFSATFPAHTNLVWTLAYAGRRRTATAGRGHPSFNNCPTDGPSDGEGAAASPGELSLSGANETRFNPQVVRLVFVLDGAVYSAAAADYALTLNGADAALAGLVVDPHAVSIDVVLEEGRNDLAFFGADSARYMVAGAYTLWAGTASQTVRVSDEAGAPVDGALVRLVIGDDASVGVETPTSGGAATFANVPPRTLIATAEAPGNLFGSAAALGNGQDVTLVLRGFDAPDPVANNDFQLGTAGWNVGAAPVEIIPHVEGDSASARGAAGAGLMPDDLDLQLGTLGEGPQRVSRAFAVEPGTRRVTVRYRFVTSEVPGGYYGSEYNDYFGVTLRSQAGGARQSDISSMNALGLGAFDASGATGWREVTLPVSEDGDVVQIDAVVANVADGAFDSQLVVDAVAEGRLAITRTDLKDRTVYGSRVDVEPLQFFSMGRNHPYRGGSTWLWGSVSVSGAAGDALADVWVEALIGRTVLTTGRLSPEGRAALLQPFGSDERIEATLTAAAPLFVFPGSYYPAADERVRLRVRARTTSGQTASFEAGRFPIVGPYLAPNRFGSGGRDAEQGGDSWARPSTLIYASRLLQHPASTDFLFNDFSNMNGGRFRPHSTHQDGLHVDTRFPGYPARDAAAAQRLVAFLNGPYGNRVDRIGVTFTTSFRNAIAGVTLADGRSASAVLRNWAEHTSHFHLWLTQPGAAGGRMADPRRAWTDRGPRQGGVGTGPALGSPRPQPLAVTVAPNPVSASGTLDVHVASPAGGAVEAVVYDALGRLVHRFAALDVAGGSATLRWRPGAMAAGVYLLRVTHTDGQVASSRFVIAE